MPWTWTGLYVGGNAGGGLGQKSWALVETVRETTPPTITTFSPPDKVSFPVDGFLGGGQLGYRFQSGMWVWGVEGTFDWTNLSGGTECGGSNICESKADWLATIAGEAGWAVDRALFYLKGGGAAIHENHSLSPMTQTTNGVSVSEATCNTCVNSETRWGWLFGAGVTYAFTSNWSAFVEYNYMDFGKRSFDFSGVATGGPAFTNTLDIAQKVQVVKTGINYRFDWLAPVVARY